MGVSKNSGTPKSSILTGFSNINHPFWGTTIFGNTHMYINSRSLESLSQNVPQMLELFGTVIAQLGGGFNFKEIYIYISPGKLTWKWKLTIFVGDTEIHLYSWLVFHCHVSFQRCFSCCTEFHQSFVWKFESNLRRDKKNIPTTLPQNWHSPSKMDLPKRKASSSNQHVCFREGNTNLYPFLMGSLQGLSLMTFQWLV